MPVLMPSCLGEERSGDKRISPYSQKVINPASKTLSRFGVRSSPLNVFSRSALVHARPGLICGEARRMPISLYPITACQIVVAQLTGKSGLASPETCGSCPAHAHADK